MTIGTKTLRFGVAISAAALCLGAASAQNTSDKSEFVPDEPLWEVRIGGTGLYGPDYPGASDQSANGVVAPLLIYRGEKIRFGEYGVARAIAAENKRFELDLSLDAVYSANSTEGGAREGMPDLDYLLQIGPQLIVNLKDTGWTADGRSSLKFRAPIRVVASTDFTGIDHVGYIAEPQLVFQRKKGGELRSGWSTTLFATFGDEGLNDYWYGVGPQFVTTDRTEYEAEAGYVSTGFRASWTKELTEDFQIFLTYQGRSFSGAANEDSPLLREEFTHAASVSFVWKAFKSKRPAQNDDM